MSTPRTIEDDYAHIQNRLAFLLSELEDLVIAYNPSERSEGILYGVNVLKTLQSEMTVNLVYKEIS